MRLQDGSIGEKLEALCDYFDDELERQQNVLVICRAIGQAARSQDLEYLEAKTEGLRVLLSEAMEAEQLRLSLVADVVEFYQLPEGQQTLTALIAEVPMPWQQRMREFQVLMRATLESTRRLVRDNNQVLRRSIGIVTETLTALSMCQPEARGQYTSQGGDATRIRTQPSLIDQRG